MNNKPIVNRKRRIVYLKENPDTRSTNVPCSGVECPGHCACASK